MAENKKKDNKDNKDKVTEKKKEQKIEENCNTEGEVKKEEHYVRTWNGKLL